MALKVRIMKNHDDAKLPDMAHEGDAGFDVYSVEDTVLHPGERKLIDTGLKMALPSGYEAQVRPKSGLAVNYGVTVLNTPGTIDAGYRGPVKVILFNASKQQYTVEKGKKIAQIVINKVECPDIEIVTSLDETGRGEGGFGSTGLESKE